MIGTTMSALLLVHILAGVTALAVAPIAMVTAKGGPTHRRWGKVYFWMMAVVAVTAVPLGLWRPNYFLILVAVFSFYFAFRGYRILLRKNPERGDGARAVDWGAAVATFLASAALVVLGISQPSPLWVRLAPVAIVFGIGGGVTTGFDMVRFVRPPTERMAWWYGHMGGMLGSYIATVTAFSVVNFDFLPTVARWLWPSVVGTPLIVLWIAYYKRKFARRPKAAAVAV
jgi:hypothetical protein